MLAALVPDSLPPHLQKRLLGALRKVDGALVARFKRATSPLHITLEVARLGCAVGATFHILLTKRNTAAAMGWIGACWMRPFSGTLLYLTFGINRVQRKAQRLMNRCALPASVPLQSLACNPPGPLQPLVRMLDLITDNKLLRGNSVQPYFSGEAAYPAMLEAINSAKTSIVLGVYIFADDKVGKQFIKALAAAVRRGVAVRVLVDGIGSGYFRSPAYDALRKAGVPAARFMHSFWPWQMTFINLRLHRKILVVDGRVGFTGGMNITVHNLVHLKQPYPIADTAFRIEGPTALQLTDTFARDWAFTTGEVLDGPTFFPNPETPGTIPTRIVASGPDRDMERIEYTMLQAVILAKKHVCFMTPYFIPDSRLATELGLAVLRGVQVDLIVPHPSNHPFVDHARDFYLRPLVKVGVNIWYGTQPFNHSKLMTVDGEWALVGSANMDPRSLRLNFEADAAIHDQAVTRKVLDYMLAQREEQLTMAMIRRWPLWKRLRNSICRLLSPYL
ncbi:cardiolipin synthase [Formicincola oecophyllae]|uniref:Cardiolipin synthase n=2 Tax=Formicincola oecophyllae TaxID=2558361 RepID=A0A4Y6UC08_9PROT|nr:cardiolipin synthase [Formicincola oecophyllae]